MKQVILVRNDLKMPKGKVSTQVAHASVSALLKSDKDDIKEWKQQGMKKVVLKVKDKEELMKFKRECEDSDLVTALIEDAGKTFFKEPEITCLGIGPDKEEKINRVTGKLKML